jgi:hypothetical protein
LRSGEVVLGVAVGGGMRLAVWSRPSRSRQPIVAAMIVVDMTNGYRLIARRQTGRRAGLAIGEAEINPAPWNPWIRVRGRLLS